VGIYHEYIFPLHVQYDIRVERGDEKRMHQYGHDYRFNAHDDVYHATLAGAGDCRQPISQSRAHEWFVTHTQNIQMTGTASSEVANNSIHYFSAVVSFADHLGTHVDGPRHIVDSERVAGDNYEFSQVDLYCQNYSLNILVPRFLYRIWWAKRASSTFPCQAMPII
jgi:hypothetical protein